MLKLSVYSIPFHASQHTHCVQLFCLPVAGEVIVHQQAKTVELSKIFKWYKQDFGPPEQLLPWLLPYLSTFARNALQELLSEAGAKNIKIKYRHYDWALNSQD